MRILLLGKSGQVGNALEIALRGHHVMTATSSTCNFLNASSLRNFVRSNPAEVIVNAAAYTNVDAAENSSSECFAINSEAVRLLAEESNRIGALLVHFSTDYVFNGRKNGLYTETDELSPLNVYGLSKASGDRKIYDIADRFLIFRLGWVYSATGRNFLKAILRLATERSELNVVSDQIGTPTHAALIGAVTATVIRAYGGMSPDKQRKASGLYNLAPSGATSRYDFAVEIVRQARNQGMELPLSEAGIRAIPSSEYPVPAKRPLNSRLDTNKLRSNFSVDLPDWKRDIGRTIGTIARNILGKDILSKTLK